VSDASRQLAEFKGVATSIPNQDILINALGLQEAKDSSAIENIVTTHDGNGRTGRILNVLYLVKQGLLDTPILYLSRHIVRTKASYYALLQSVRDQDTWEDWVLYMLSAVEHSARAGVGTVKAIKQALLDVKKRIREQHPRIYSQDLVNNLFKHPYTQIDYLQRDLDISRITATKYLNALTDSGLLAKLHIGRNNYYINIALNAVLNGTALTEQR